MSRPEPGTPPRFRTLAIHAGQDPSDHMGAVMTPIYQTSTFAFRGVNQPGPYDYSRSGNPTRKALEVCLARLEDGVAGFAFATGMAAEATLLMMFRRVTVSWSTTICTAERTVFSSPCFATSRSRPSMSICAIWPHSKPLCGRRKAVWIETPTNPLMSLVDLGAVAALARRAGAITICDNTFLSPYFQRPLDFGIDVVVHSTTKYINGHSDVVGGAIVERPRVGRASRVTCKTPWAPAPVRRTASWCCAGSRHWPCAWRSTTGMRWRSRGGWGARRK